MKKISKLKKILTTLLVVLSFVLNTEAAFERREMRQSNEARNKAQKNDNEMVSFNINKYTNLQKEPRLRYNGTDLGGNPNDDDTPLGTPIRNALPLFLGFSLVYGICVFYRKEKESI